VTAPARSSFTATETAFHVEAQQKIEYSLRYADGAFAVGNTEIADSYRAFGRCLMVVDQSVYELYGEQIHAYFDHYEIELSVFPVAIPETGKTLRTVERIVDAFGEFGLVRKEPVLVVGGGLTTDVAGFACSVFRRSTNYNRVPTTLIGLIDASVAIKVAVNHGKYKNRLGAFHASQNVILDFSFLKTLPHKEVRNGMAELIKISAVANIGIFELLEKYGPDLVATRFGHLDGTPELREIAHRVTYDAIHTMLSLEVPNLHEDDLDRVIAFGHTWSPLLELTPEVPFFHGHDRRAAGLHLGQRPGPDLLADEPARPVPQQPLPHPGPAAPGDGLDHPDPRRPAPRRGPPADRDLLLRQRPDHRGA
jgi:3-dehydroquinate synthase